MTIFYNIKNTYRQYSKKSGFQTFHAKDPQIVPQIDGEPQSPTK